MPKQNNIEKIPELIREIYAIVRELETRFPGRKFTPDGHMVGGLGEVLAAYYYDIELYPASAKAVDGRAQASGEEVQIKATQGNKIGIRHNCQKLLVLQLLPDGNFREVYNGDGDRVWRICAKQKRPSNGQFPISVRDLEKLQQEVLDREKIQRVA